MPAFCSEFLRWTLVPLDAVSRTTGTSQNACRPVFNLLLPRIYLISSHILLLYAVPFYSKLKPLDSWIPFSLQLETVQHKLRKSFKNMFGCDLAIYDGWIGFSSSDKPRFSAFCSQSRPSSTAPAWKVLDLGTTNSFHCFHFNPWRFRHLVL